MTHDNDFFRNQRDPDATTISEAVINEHLRQFTQEYVGRPEQVDFYQTQINPYYYQNLYHENLRQIKRKSRILPNKTPLNGKYHKVNLFACEGVSNYLLFKSSGFIYDIRDAYNTTASNAIANYKDIYDVVKKRLPTLLQILSNPGARQALQYKFHPEFYVYDDDLKTNIFNCCPMCGNKMEHKKKKQVPVTRTVKQPYQVKNKHLDYFAKETHEQRLKRLLTQNYSVDSHCSNNQCLFHSISYDSGFNMNQLNQADMYNDYIVLLASKYVHVQKISPISFGFTPNTLRNRQNNNIEGAMIHDSSSEEKLIEYIPVLQQDVSTVLPKTITIPRSIM